MPTSRLFITLTLLASAAASPLEFRGGSLSTNLKAQRSAFSLALEDLQSNTKDLLFTEHGDCGLPTRKSARCTDGYAKAAVANVMAGMTCALAMIPEAVSFAFVAGVSPLCGLWTTVVMGASVALGGGRGGVMTGASGACAVVLAELVHSHGVEFLGPTVLLAGILQIVVGKARAGKFIRLVPHPVMLGFVNGLAIVIAKAQFSHFKDPLTGQFFDIRSPKGMTMAGLTAITVALIKLIPKVSTTIPASLVSIILVTLGSTVLKLPAVTLADLAGKDTFAGGWSVLPKLGLPNVPMNLSTMKTVFHFAVTMAAVGLVESLLTLQLVDGLLEDGTQGSTSRESTALGVGNILSGLTSGMGGCALLGQSLINVNSGGTTRLSGAAMAALLAVGIVAAAPLLASVPVASLVGLMFMVSFSTFSWSSLRLITRIPRIDAATLALVSIVTVYKDLAVAVVAGTVLSALSFAWRQSTDVDVRAVAGDPAVGSAVLSVDGIIYFGSAANFQRAFDPTRMPENEVVLDFANARVLDHSGMEAVNAVCKRFGEAGKVVRIRNLSSECGQLMKDFNDGDQQFLDRVIETGPDDPNYRVAVD
ncbi:hypothetical protein TrLO_g8514 [Triparma laevis f. longispina]|nr:hypothetical protein TrLO_g8514 [Triparma laevis f. longispina]